MKLNLGCGLDYREGWVNVDGSSVLSKVDQIIEVPQESLLVSFYPESVSYVLMKDFLEHHFRWEAEHILKECFSLL